MLLGALDTYRRHDHGRHHAVGRDRAEQDQQVTPIITWYLLGDIAVMPLLGRLSDRFGRKLVLQASLLALSASVVRRHCQRPDHGDRLAPIQGVASGALLPVTLALAADLVARNRARCSAVSAPPGNSAACSARSTASAWCGC